MRQPARPQPPTSGRVEPRHEETVSQVVGRMSEPLRAALAHLLYDPGAKGDRTGRDDYSVVTSRGIRFGPFSETMLIPALKRRWIVPDPEAGRNAFRGNPEMQRVLHPYVQRPR